MRVLGAVLDPVARRRGFATASLLADWPEIIGPALARRCQPVRIETGRGRVSVLHLQCSGAFAVELQHAAPQILERINAHFGFRAVARIRLVQAGLPPRVTSDLAREPDPPSPEAEAALQASLTQVADESLRERLLRLGRTVQGRRR